MPGMPGMNAWQARQQRLNSHLNSHLISAIRALVWIIIGMINISCSRRH